MRIRRKDDEGKKQRRKLDLEREKLIKKVRDLREAESGAREGRN